MVSRLGDFGVGASPVPEIQAGATRYSKQAGLYVPNEPDYSRVAMSPVASRHIANAYDRMPEFNKEAVSSYRQMAEETGRQFDFMTKSRSRGGLGIDVQVTPSDPYGNNGFNPVDNLVQELRHDVSHNNQIKVLSTKSTGGHAVFSDDQNDMFRAVHDVFGHLGSGRGIDMHGEEAAYQKHSQMFSPLARQAMATETRGQNAALHKYGEFQDQKIGILPRHLQSRQFATFGGSPADYADARLENRKQGLI